MEEWLRVIREPVSRSDLAALSKEQFGDMVKAVVDVEREIMAIGGELHSDEEALLLDDGSRQPDLWGINLYPGQPDEDWIEFDSMINVRASHGNRSRSVEDSDVQARIQAVVDGVGDHVMAAGGVGKSAAPAAARWHTLAMVEQMANIGSEVERALRAFDQGRTDRFDHALRRALELFDLTAADERWRGARRREMLRVRETFCGVFFSEPAARDPGLGEYLRSYFLQFAVAARQAAGNRTR
jgi:hypothetical protein